MQWTTFWAVAAGAVIGALGTGIADRLRWRRDVSEQERRALQAAYAEFLNAVKRTGSAISQAAHDETSPQEERARLARLAVEQHGLYESQAHVELCAPAPLFPLINEQVLALLSLRDEVVRGGGPGTPRYEGAWMKIHATGVHIREDMRATLGRP
ncbi:hypothetical protein ABZX39_18275 [Streptomyces collinus]|uniref:hypothetical protein n=1 Tax=Streptomyces collinus TaxID=42684 RepID=UPI0033ACCD05